MRSKPRKNAKIAGLKVQATRPVRKASIRLRKTISRDEWTRWPTFPRTPKSRGPEKKNTRKRKGAPTPAALTEDRWKTADDPDPRPRAHPFRPARAPGVQLDTFKSYSPLDLFQLFFSPSVVRTLCANTNKHAYRRIARGMRTTWLPLNEAEMYRYLGLLIAMALMKTHELRDYWSQKRLYNHPFYRSVMRQHRFSVITYNLHMSDPDKDAENNAKRGTPEFDGLCAVKPLMDSVKAACKAFYQPRQQLSVDERMVASKANIVRKRHMKARPNKSGIELFVLADPANGYTCDFNVYCGESASSVGKGAAHDAVMDLLDVPYLGTGYHVYMGNFYASTALFQDLHRMRFGACGNVPPNEQGFPRPGVNDKPRRAERGTVQWLRKDPLLFVKWMDAREVRVCSTIHQVFTGDTMERRVRNPQDNAWTTVKMPVPTAVKEYNKYMGGVDLSSSLIKSYNVRQRTKKWYKTLFYHFIDIAVVNAFLLHKELSKLKNTKPLPHKQFREELCLQLADFGVERAPVTPATLETPPPAKTVVIQEDPYAELGPIMHMVTSITDRTTVEVSQKATAGRKRCVHCLASKKHMSTIWQCQTCNVALCVIADRNCFLEWHEKRIAENRKVKKIKQEEA
ncbi:hypothetical protein SKAU_G00420620 [Synaphobranchus kaupii]|uniref:PiggyBac transposable element-derived protein domain-containing protein n=1 Tax=Synaphobranchus kaupii TaxID=118154 RepID=A0A9Q1IB36_SYNKA|nr:hypothetical protein SKAU_G00420620 [Synaphobranchus kaupii]